MFYQILKDFYTSNLFETCFMDANDDLKGKTTHFTGFYANSISGQKVLKPAHSVTQTNAIAKAILELYSNYFPQYLMAFSEYKTDHFKDIRTWLRILELMSSSTYNILTNI